MYALAITIEEWPYSSIWPKGYQYLYIGTPPDAYDIADNVLKIQSWINCNKKELAGVTDKHECHRHT